MSRIVVWWTLLAAMAVVLVFLFNYWASFQPLSTLAYSGIVLTLAGLANVGIPFRFLGVRTRTSGALILAGGAALALAALFWPAPVIRVAQHRIRLDDIMPEYQFNERHSARIHASRARIMQAVRESTWGDLKSLTTLSRIRRAALRAPEDSSGAFSSDKRILDAFAASGYIFGGSENEIVMAGGADTQAKRPIEAHSMQEFTEYRKEGAVKVAFDFTVEDAGGGWCTLTTETRMAALDGSSHGPAVYWRLIVPGSGLLRREWLEGIKRRAEIARQPAS